MKYFLFASLILISCARKNTMVEQVNSDLIAMLENKVEVQNLIINKTSPFFEGGKEFDSVYFDCNLYFTDDLFADDFKFNKGMKVSAHNNVFLYDKSLKLKKIKFGKIKVVD